MKLLLVLVLALAATPLAFAACPNHCSGHGTCGANDICSCYANWKDEPDCSTKTCPYGNAWVDTSYGVNDAHNYAVCSNKGSCDGKSGECSCFDGYEGKACQRTVCPNACSGHGTCHTIAKLASDNKCKWNGETQAPDEHCAWANIEGYSVTAGDVTYTEWDAQMTQGCSCDAGWSGADCSGRLCPLGDDILTTCTAGTSNDQVNHVSFVEVIAPAWTTNNTQDTAAGVVDGCTPPSYLSRSQNQPSFVLNFVDQYNKVWTTRPIPVHRLGDHTTITQPHSATQDNSANDIKEALEELPNGAVPSVTVTYYEGSCQSTTGNTCNWNGGGSKAIVNPAAGCLGNITTGIQHQWYRIAFEHGANSGNHKNKLSCQWKGCTLTGNHMSSVDTRQSHDNTGGCSPYYNGLGAHYGNNDVTAFPKYFDSIGVPLCRVYDDPLAANNVWDDDTYVPDAMKVVTGDKERVPCSKRGICNSEDGLCECFEGFRGEACEEQLALS